MKILRPYQRGKRGLKYLRETYSGALYWEMRLGKTLTIIRAFSDLPGCKLVICPLSVMSVWQDELNDDGENRNTVVYGSKHDRLRLLTEDSDWYITNWECHRVIDILRIKKWKLVIFDESTYLCNNTSKMTKYYTKSNKLVPYRFLLSGSPDPHGPIDYYTQLNIINPKLVNYKNFWNWRNEYFMPIGFDWRIRYDKDKELRKILHTACSFLTRREVGSDLPKVFQRRKVFFKPKLEKLYKQIKNKSVLDEENMIASQYAVVKWNWMRALCGGFYKDELICDDKMKEMKKVMSELKDSQIVIFAEYVKEIEHISKVLNVEPVHGGVSLKKRINLIKDFKAGKNKYFVANHECFKMGLNLSVADVLIFYSLPDSLLTWQQVQDRALDISKNKGCLIITLEYDKSIDQHVFESLQKGLSKTEMIKNFYQSLAEDNNENNDS